MTKKLTEDEVGMKHFGPHDRGAAYSSAIAIDFGGQRQYVQFLATTVAGVAAADGKPLWRCDKPANGMKLNISTPIYHGACIRRLVGWCGRRISAAFSGSLVFEVLRESLRQL